MMAVDHEPYQEFVGDAFDIAVAEGQALLLIVLQDSRVNFLDGKDVGPSKDVHVWVSVVGPRSGTQIPVVGAQRTLETMSWFSLFGGSSHPRVRTAFATAGLRYEPVEDFSLIHSGPEIQGNVVFSPGRSLSWKAKAEAPSIELIGVNHDFYTRGQDGKLIVSHVQALLKASALGSRGMLDVQGDIAPGGLIPAGTNPVMVNSYNPIWVRASLNVSALE